MNDLHAYKADRWSQDGEDGVLFELFKRLGVSHGRCVEFGAWDGLVCSNTANLIRNHGWSGLFIEGDSAKYQELVRNYAPYPQVTCLNRMVGLEPSENLDAVIRSVGWPVQPTDIDLVSIDVDGLDYHIFDDMREYRPKVVVVEVNPTIPNVVEFVQPRKVGVFQGNSALSMVKLAESKGYTLACALKINLIFVRNDLVRQAGGDVTLANGRDDEFMRTHIFNLYDGTVCLSGYKNLYCHDIPLDPEKFQVLPKEKRIYPGAV